MFSIDTDYSLKNGGFCKWRGFGQTKNPPFSRFYCTRMFTICLFSFKFLVLLSTETRVFEELNVFHFEDKADPSRPPHDLDLDFVPEPEPKGCLPYLFSKLKTKSSTNSNSANSTTTTATNTATQSSQPTEKTTTTKT